MNLNFKQLRIASISDIHLGHPRNDTQFIISNLNKYFSNSAFLSKCDIVFIVGDLFDNLLSLPSDEAAYIDKWIASFLRLCKLHDVVLRVLEGTPSHDRKQSQRFTIINEINDYGGRGLVDLQYVKTLSVEHIDKFSIDVLYIPDEWSHDTATTLAEVKVVMAAHKLAQVDLAIMHGLFDYQMNDVVKPHIKHDSAQYHDLVKGLIFIGHIHKSSNQGKIYAQGSFDRLAHGEEEPKGFFYAQLESDYNYTINFIENKSARKFVTIKCTNLDTEVNLAKINKVATKLADNSFVRISSKSDNPIISNLDTFKRNWPTLNWSVHLKDKEDNTDEIVFTKEITYDAIILNKETLPTLMKERLFKNGVNPLIVDRCQCHLDEFL